jgi:hypothetical protein
VSGLMAEKEDTYLQFNRINKGYIPDADEQKHIHIAKKYLSRVVVEQWEHHTAAEETSQ